MRKSMILAAVAALAMVSSCQKEDAPVQDSTPDMMTFTASIVDPTTKTTINTDASSANRGKVSWEVNDAIGIYDGTNSAVYYIKEASDIAVDGSATFTYKSGTKLSPTASKYTASYTGRFSKSQTYSATAGKLPMNGESDPSDKSKLNFTVSCGLLKLSLAASSTETDKTISKVEITGTNANGTKATYTLSCNSEVSISSAADFYIALPAGSYYDMVFYNKSGYVCQKRATTEMSIEANKIQPVTFTGITFNLLPGIFTVNADGKQVRFTKGNLYYSTTDSKYHIEYAQNVTYAMYGQTDTYDAKHVCHFFWSNNKVWQDSGKEPWASSYGGTTGRTASDIFFCGVENPLTVDGQSGLYALSGKSSGEWNYLFKTRTDASKLHKTRVTVTTSAGTLENCVVIAPDGYTGVIASTYTAAEWAVAEASGLVCLPSAGSRNRTSISESGTFGCYWSATTAASGTASELSFDTYDTPVYPAKDAMRSWAVSIRLVATVE